MSTNTDAPNGPFLMDSFVNWDGFELDQSNSDALLTLPIGNSEFVDTDGLVPQEDIDNIWHHWADGVLDANENINDSHDLAPLTENMAQDQIAAYFFDHTGEILPMEQSVS